MLAKAQDPNCASRDGATALHEAFWAGQVRIAHLLLEARSDTGLADNGGRTALHLATQDSLLELVRLLLDAAADGW